MSAAVVVANTVACNTTPRLREPDPVRLSGCFRRIYGDPPPTATSGTVWYTLTTDAGATTLLEVSPALLQNAGGATRLDRARVSVVLAPSRDSSQGPNRTAKVREITREPDDTGASC